VGANGTILKTTDGGITWEYTVLGQYTHFDISFFDQNKGILVGANTYLTGTGGLTWAKISINQSGFMTCAYFTETNCIVMGSSGDIYKSSNSGVHWESKVYGDRNTISDMLFLDPMTGFAAGSNGTLLKTFDGGSHWPKQTPLTNEKLTSISFSDNQRGYIVGTNSVFLKSTTGGISWIANSIPDCYDLFSVDFINNDVGWVAGNYGKILKTTDSGNTWMQQPINVSWTIDFSSISMVDENIGYACGNYRSFYPPKGIILKTSNGGIGWDSLKSFNSDFNSIFFQSSLNGWVVGETQNMTLHTTDGGITWTNVPIGGGNDIFFSDSYNGIKVSNVTLWSDISITTDGGETWAQQPIVTNQYLLTAYIVESNYWTAGLNGAILYSNNPIVTNMEIENETNKHPVTFKLSQNYPNPFNPTTKIKFEIPGQARNDNVLVTLKVYDILGREVAILVNEESATGGAGEYEVEFNGNNIPSGIYFYQLKAGEYSETRKMVLMK